MIDYCILMVWGANIEASKKNIFFSSKIATYFTTL